jgi:hypothetical protein
MHIVQPNGETLITTQLYTKYSYTLRRRAMVLCTI